MPSAQTCPVRQARNCKIVGYRLLDSEYSIWIDATYTPRADMLALIYRHLTTADVATFPHFCRDKVIDEAAEIIKCRIDDPRLVKDQMRRLHDDGFPDNVGLSDTSVLLRRHTSDVHRMCNIWWETLDRGSRRDQLSFDYAAWKAGVRVNRITPGLTRGHDNYIETFQPYFAARFHQPKLWTQPEPQNLAVVTCHFNPMGYSRTITNYKRFMANMKLSGVPVYSAELAFDDKPFVTDSILKLRGTSRHVLWQKENLLNALERILPPEIDAVAWIDADVYLLDPNWPSRTLRWLAQYDIVQMWEHAYWTNSHGTISEVFQSCGSGGNHPGFAWAARRHVFPLYDGGVMGSADTLMAIAWGLSTGFKLTQLTDANRAHFLRWMALQQGNKVGFVRSGLCHMWHGDRAKRYYRHRQEILYAHNYDPVAETYADENGLKAWTDYALKEKPALVEWVASYFIRRQEDG